MSKQPHLGPAFLLIAVTVLCFMGWVGTVSGDGRKERSIPPIPTEPFSPSNARTEEGGLIPVEQFFSSKRCAGCHQDTHPA